MSARGVEVFRRFFEKIVEQCQQAGLVWGKELYVNATKVKANASLDSLTPRFAVEAHLSTLFPFLRDELQLVIGLESVSPSDDTSTWLIVVSTDVDRRQIRRG